MKKSISEEIKGNVNFVGTGGVAQASSNVQDLELDPKSQDLLSLLYVLLGFVYSSLKENQSEYKSYDGNGYAKTETIQKDQLAAEVVGQFPTLATDGATLHTSTFSAMIPKCFQIAGLVAANTSSRTINTSDLKTNLNTLRRKLSSSTFEAAYARAKTNRLEKFIRSLISSNFSRNTEIQSLLLTNFKEYAEAKNKLAPLGTVQLARNLFEKIPGYLIYASLYDYSTFTKSEDFNNIKIFIKNYVQFTKRKSNENSLFQILDTAESGATEIQAIPAVSGAPAVKVPLDPAMKTGIESNLQVIRRNLLKIEAEVKGFATNFDPFLGDRKKILDSTAKNILPDYPKNFVAAINTFTEDVSTINQQIFLAFDRILNLIKRYFTVGLGTTITNPALMAKFKESYDFEYERKNIQLNQSGPYFSKMKSRANAKSTYLALREITKFTENYKQFPSSFNRPVAENKFVFDLDKLKENRLNESYVRMYGNWVKMILGALLGNFSIPVTVKGSEKDVLAFASALNSEARYLKAAQKYGLTDNRTYSVKSTLESSIKKFEKETGLIWPFK